MRESIEAGWRFVLLNLPRAWKLCKVSRPAFILISNVTFKQYQTVLRFASTAFAVVHCCARWHSVRTGDTRWTQNVESTFETYFESWSRNGKARIHSSISEERQSVLRIGFGPLFSIRTGLGKRPSFILAVIEGLEKFTRSITCSIEIRNSNGLNWMVWFGWLFTAMIPFWLFNPAYSLRHVAQRYESNLIELIFTKWPVLFPHTSHDVFAGALPVLIMRLGNNGDVVRL